jgi:hypothetical protein
MAIPTTWPAASLSVSVHSGAGGERPLPGTDDASGAEPPSEETGVSLGEGALDVSEVDSVDSEETPPAVPVDEVPVTLLPLSEVPVASAEADDVVSLVSTVGTELVEGASPSSTVVTGSRSVVAGSVESIDSPSLEEEKEVTIHSVGSTSSG